MANHPKHTRTSDRRPIVMVTAAAAVMLAAGFAPAQGPAGGTPDPLSFRGPDPSVRFESVEIEQNLGAEVPLDLQFKNAQGETVTIGELLDGKPALLALVYYECPMLCTQVTNGVEGALAAMKYKVGEDFKAIMVSIDPDETPELAAQKKANHVERLNVPGAEDGWHFLTGEESQIDALADTVGYMYVYDQATDQYAHDAGIMLLTPQGVVSRYYYGIDYLPRDVELGLVEASKGEVGNLADKLRLLCFQYDPSTGKYGFYIIGAMRIGAGLMIVGFLSFWGLHYLQSRRKAGSAGGGDGGGAGSSAPQSEPGPSAS